jgi:hypothetical protein
VWQQTWTHEYDAGKCFLSVWKDGARLRWINGLTALDGSDATRWYATTPSSTTSTVYIYSADDPNDETVWEITRRLHGVRVGANGRIADS